MIDSTNNISYFLIAVTGRNRIL